ncbi:hypothetical protein HDV06_002787 [Boothiomyces sp. JEL0866]|nr:hypothetical protein HDV06_002787 [Boothiomyces sp. JEL0866]
MNADIIPDSRSKQVVTQLLLDDPLLVSPHDLDPSLVDTSAEHRQQMRKKIYAKQENFKPKQIAQSMNSTHFSMEIGKPPKDSKSSIKTDYIKYDLKNIHIPSRYGANPVGEGKFPLLSCEEMGEPLRLANKKPIVTIKTRLDERPSWKRVNSSTKSISHISLGNDQNDWQSISQKTLLPHEYTLKNEHSEYELLEKTKSTVLDNPDLVLDPIQTVHQSEIDWKSLMFDNSVSKKALNGTHFTLGNETESQLHSEYKTLFIPLKKSKRKIKKAENSSSLCIIAEDFEDRHIGTSSQKIDYPLLSLRSNTQVDVSAIKKTNSRSSIVFGNGESFVESKSLAQHDFNKPLEKNPAIAKERYERGGRIESVPGCVPYQSLIGNQEGPQFESVHRQDYKKIDLSKFTDNARVDTKDFRKSHFSFECNPDENGTFKKKDDGIDYEKLNELKQVVPAGYGGNQPVTRVNDQFQVTVNNTVTRYPYITDTFETTVQQTYKGLDAPRSRPYNPPHDQVEDHLHPQLTQCGNEFKHIRELSTVNRRTFVAPEVMKGKM